MRIYRKGFAAGVKKDSSPRQKQMNSLESCLMRQRQRKMLPRIYGNKAGPFYPSKAQVLYDWGRFTDV